MENVEIRDNIEYIHLPSALEFINALAPWSPRLGDKKPKSWIFRGHSRKGWSLVPSALRSQDALLGIIPRRCETNREQISAELDTLLSFFDIADTSGISLPEDSQRLRTAMEKLRVNMVVGRYFDELKNGQVQWPPEEFLSVAGLAQHYGLPTRLLDWTYSSYIAAYFAASGVVKAAHDARHQKRTIKDYCKRKGYDYDDTTARISIGGYDRLLAVWAYNLGINIAVKHDCTKEPPYRLVHVPYATNPYISAQKGLFTLTVNSSLDGDAEVERTSFDRSLIAYFGDRDFPPEEVGLLTCFYTTHDQAFEILRLLAGLGVTAGSVFPGIAGASATVSERLWWWDKSD